MRKQIAIVLALGGLCLGATACEGDDSSDAKSTSTPPAASAPAPDGTAPTAPSTTAPTPGSSATPRVTPTEPKISNSRRIVMIDPDGKRYTFRTMVQMAAGMRATMGKNAPASFCAKSYEIGVKEGGKFPAGRGAFMAACQEGWRLGA